MLPLCHMSLHRCNYHAQVAIVGFNEDFSLLSSPPVDVFATCNGLLAAHRDAWDSYFSKHSYGVWLILLAAIYFFLSGTLMVLVVGSHYSCLVYGKSYRHL